MLFKLLTGKLGKYAILGVVIFSTFIYINTLNSRVTKMTVANAKLSDSIVTLERSELILNNLYTAEKLGKLNQLKLNEKFNRHNFDILLIKKPKLMQKIINKASNSRNRCLEYLMNIDFTEQELQHETNNNVCPNIFNGLVSP